MELWGRWKAWWRRDPWIAGLTPVAVVLLLLAASQVVVLVDDVRSTASLRAERAAEERVQRAAVWREQERNATDTDDRAASPSEESQFVQVRGVVRGPDGSPVGGVRVAGSTVPYSSVPTAGGTLVRAVTDERGRFHWGESLRGERLWVSFRPPRETGLAAQYLGGGADGTQVSPLRLTGEVNRADVTLQPAATISGTVRDRSGNATTDGGEVQAQVTAAGTPRSEDSAVMVRRTRIRPDGSYRLTGLPPGEYVVSVGANGSPAWSYHPDTLRLAEATVLLVDSGEHVTGADVTVPDPGTISGRVLDPDGTPVAGVGLTLRLVEPMGPSVGTCCILDALETTTTDAEGRYRFTDDRGYGNLRISVAVPARSSFVKCVPPAAVEFRPDEDVHHDFRLARGATITGQVTGPGGRGLAGKRVSAVPDRDEAETGCGARTVTRTDAQGRFTLEGLGAGATRVRVAGDEDHLSSHRSGSGPATVRVRADSRHRDVALTVRRAARVEGRMVIPPDAMEAARLPSEVCLYAQVDTRKRRQSWCQGWERVRDFSFSELEPGRYWLSARWGTGERYFTGARFSQDEADAEVFELGFGSRRTVRAPVDR